MAKKQFVSLARVKQRARNVKPTPDNRLDLSDIPEATDAQLRRARRVGRPVTGNAKQLIAIRIAPRLLAQLRRLAAKQSKPYQTFIHELLERAVGRRVPNEAGRAFRFSEGLPWTKIGSKCGLLNGYSTRRQR